MTTRKAGIRQPEFKAAESRLGHRPRSAARRAWDTAHLSPRRLGLPAAARGPGRAGLMPEDAWNS